MSTRAFMKDAAAYIPSMLVPAALSILSLPIFTRKLDPGQWGDYILILNTAELMALIAVSWLCAAVVRFREQGMRELGSAKFARTLVALTVTSVGVILVPALMAGLLFHERLLSAYALPWLVCGVVVYAARSFSEIFAGVMRAARLVWRYSMFICLQSGLRFAVGLVLLLVWTDGVTCLLVGAAAGAIVPLVLYGGRDGAACRVRSGVDWGMARAMAVYALPITVADVAYWALRLSDRYLLRFFRNATEVGLYAVGVDLSDRTIALVVSLFAMASWPLAVQVWERNGVAATADLLSRMTRLYILVCLPVTVLTAILSEPLLVLLTGPKYLAVASIMPMVVGCVFLYGLQRFFQIGIALTKRTRLILIATLVGAVANLALAACLVPSRGYPAAALSRMIGYAVFTTCIILFSRRLIVWRFPWFTLFRTSGACLLMGGAAWGVCHYLPLVAASKLAIGGVLGVATYGITLFMTGEIAWRDALAVARRPSADWLRFFTSASGSSDARS